MIPLHPVAVKVELTADLPWPALTRDELDQAIARHQRLNEASVSLTLFIEQAGQDDPPASPLARPA